MFTFIANLLNYIPQPYRLIVQIGVVVLLIVLGFYLFGSIRSCQYDKARREYQEKENAAKAERDKLIGENAQLRTQIAELEPKALAYTAIIEGKVKVDEGLKDKIEKITEDAANAENTAQSNVPCRVRADRLCALFRASDWNFNCNVLYAECGQ